VRERGGERHSERTAKLEVEQVEQVELGVRHAEEVFDCVC